MLKHIHVRDVTVQKLIRTKQVLLGGNQKLKIYGRLSCVSGKRMKRENRVFFISEEEALSLNYRPCAHCSKKKYREWKLRQ